MTIEDRLQFALHLADKSEEIILDYYQNPGLQVELKRDRSVVTDADRNAEIKIRDLIKKEFPSDTIIGEEFGQEEGSSGFSWILDPVDGTQSFVCGVPLFGTLIGLTQDRTPILGVVNFPALKERYYASKGQGAWWIPANESRPLKASVSAVSNPKDSIFCTTSIGGYDQIGRRDLLDKLLAASGKSRGWGDCYGHMLVATGRAEVMVDPLMNLWDCAALYPIITEAGGHFFDLLGRDTIEGGSAVSTNHALRGHYQELICGNVR